MSVSNNYSVYFACRQDDLLDGQFWALGRFNLLGGQLSTQFPCYLPPCYPVKITNLRLQGARGCTPWYKSWMFMSAMVQMFSWGERWMFYFTRRSWVEWTISSFTEWKYLFHCMNGKHLSFVLYNLYKKIIFKKKIKRKSIERRHSIHKPHS